MLKIFLGQLTKATDIAIVIASALVVLAFLTSDYPESNIEATNKAKATVIVTGGAVKVATEDLVIAKQVTEDITREAEAAKNAMVQAASNAEEAANTVGTATAAEIANALALTSAIEAEVDAANASVTATSTADLASIKLTNAIAAGVGNETIELLIAAAQDASTKASNATEVAATAAAELATARAVAQTSEVSTATELAKTMAIKAKDAAEALAQLATAKDLALKAVAKAEKIEVAAKTAAEAAIIAMEAVEISEKDAMKFYVWWLQPIRENTMILIDSAGVDGFIALFAALIFYLAYKRRKSFFDRFFNYRFKQ